MTMQGGDEILLEASQQATGTDAVSRLGTRAPI